MMVDPDGLDPDDDDIPMSGRALYGQAFKQGKAELGNMPQNRAGSDERRTFSDMMGSVPLWNVYRALTGNDPIAGRTLSASERAGAGAMVAIGAVARAGGSGGKPRVRVYNVGPTRQEMRQIIARWDKGTYPTSAQSLKDHAMRKGFGTDWLRYYRTAINFNKKGAHTTGLRPDGTQRWRRRDGSVLIERGGGIVSYTPRN